VHQDHGTDFDFVGVGNASTMRASLEHGRSGTMSVGSDHVCMSVSTDSTSSEAVVGKDHGGTVALSMLLPKSMIQWLSNRVTLAGFPGKMVGE
jgi:hypothetical protein